MMPRDKVRPPAGNRRAQSDGFNVKSILPPSADESGSLRALLEKTADEYGLPLAALTVLARQNDPFRFDTPAGHRDGVWQAIAPFYDDGLARRVRDAREDWLEQARTIVDAEIDADRREPLAEQLQAQLDAMREEITKATEQIREQIRIDASDFDLPEIIVPEAEIDEYEQPTPLIDSEWDFAEQCQALIDSKAYRDGDDS
jgi:hypothetical protein